MRSSSSSSAMGQSAELFCGAREKAWHWIGLGVFGAFASPEAPHQHHRRAAVTTSDHLVHTPILLDVTASGLDQEMDLFPMLFLVLGLLGTGVQAQFGFFDQMFGGGGSGHQHHQQQQNVRSDAQWYQQQYEGGMLSPVFYLKVHI